MPKKRHQNKYSKPPSVAPLSLSSSSRTSTEQHARSVNELLADARRGTRDPSAAQASVAALAAPSVPPALRQILQLPDMPEPAPRTPLHHIRRAMTFIRDNNGRRRPPGPPPPRSWLALSRSRHAPADLSHQDRTGRIQHWQLPGAYHPQDGSFLDMVLRQIASDWETQREWNRFYIYTLPSKLRAALICYLATLHEPGVSIDDLRLVFAGPREAELAEYGVEKPDVARMNRDVFYLDLTGSMGSSVTLKSLADFLFPPKAVAQASVQDSWDAPDDGPDMAPEPTHLLPNLTHLSLAINPGSGKAVSWRQLLSLATKLSTLTHLNLSGWPAPTLTPNAIFAKVVSSATGRTTDYGGTNAYSHNLDDDWSEAVLVVKRLSKALYSLEYLDVTGCGDWLPALRKEGDIDDSTRASVDWAGDWGKLTHLRLCSGYAADPNSTAQLNRLWDWKNEATRVEKHIIAQRAGRGRFITVETDDLDDRPAKAREGI